MVKCNTSIVVLKVSTRRNFMNIKNLTPEELEQMSYTDLTYLLLKENKKSMNTPTIFKEICKLLGYTDSEYADKIGDYYTSLTIDKRFVLLDNNEWDIRDNHSVEIVMDDEEEIDEPEEETEEEEVVEEPEEEDTLYDDESEIVDDDDDMDDLAIVSDEELEEE